jgi:hypothetical protein
MPIGRATVAAVLTLVTKQFATFVATPSPAGDHGRPDHALMP